MNKIAGNEVDVSNDVDDDETFFVMYWMMWDTFFIQRSYLGKISSIEEYLCQ